VTADWPTLVSLLPFFTSLLAFPLFVEEATEELAVEPAPTAAIEFRGFILNYEDEAVIFRIWMRG